jgi:hypothetical protein
MAWDYGEMAGFDFCTKREMGVTTMRGAGESEQRLDGFDVKRAD